jgi:Helix-turn-helix domain
MRRKIFGMVAVPLDANEKVRLLHRARAMMRATEKGKHYGAVSAKTYAVLCAILMQFHNCRSGRAFPSYDAIQEAAGCCRQTVAAALAVLEECGLLTVLNRLVRVRWKDELARAWRVRVMRTSNCYAFPSDKPSESKLQGGTGTQVLDSSLLDALDRLQRGLRGRRGLETPLAATTGCEVGSGPA